MKKTILLLLILFNSVLFSQKIATVSNAVVQFEASVPFFEPVAAINDNVHVALNKKRGYISFEIMMTKFIFERGLMQEHFNDHYLETDRYPKGNFKGIIEGYDTTLITKYPKTFLIKGKIKIHGISKYLTTKAIIKNTKEGMELTAHFELNSDDFNIEVPSLIREKIAKKVKVFVFAVFPNKNSNLQNITINLKSSKIN